jgi:hypothetical protein
MTGLLGSTARNQLLLRSGERVSDAEARAWAQRSGPNYDEPGVVQPFDIVGNHIVWNTPPISDAEADARAHAVWAQRLATHDFRPASDLAYLVPGVGQVLSARDLGSDLVDIGSGAIAGDWDKVHDAAGHGMLDTIALMPAAGAFGALKGMAGRFVGRLAAKARPVPQHLELTTSMESISAGLYNPQKVAPRPFEADYPAGAPSDARGNLTHTIDGDPITARWVVGRKDDLGSDVAFPQAELDALTEAGTGRRAAMVPSREIQGDAGRTAIDRRSNLPVQVRINRDLEPEQVPLVHAHENSHVIDYLSGQIDSQGLTRELQWVYNDLNNPDLQWIRQQNPDVDVTKLSSKYRNYGPLNQGYSKKSVRDELIAEALRAYLTDPNYLKTVAPKTAKAIRGVNKNPTVAPIIQFNGWAPFALSGTALGAGSLLDSGNQ